MAGGLLARNQGLATLNRVREELEAGRLPAESLFDGLLILIAGVVLITPGLLTDCLGFLLLDSLEPRDPQATSGEHVEQAVFGGEE